MQTGLLKKAETVKSLAQRNGVTVDYINDLISQGMKVESEHSANSQVQRTIAIQHLSENLQYYKKLKKMEASFEKGGNLEATLSNTPAGGALVSIVDGKQVVHNDGSKGGMFQGRRHTENGIKGIVDGSSQVEVEDEEALIIPTAVNKPGTNNFNGQQLSNKEILSKINQEAGGVPIKKHGGEIKKDGGSVENNGNGQAIRLQGSSVIITRNALLDDTKKDFNGEMLTNKQILSKINQSGGGAAFADGGNLPEQISCSMAQYSYGGKMMHAEEIATDMNNSCGCKHSMEAGGNINNENTKEAVLAEIATIKLPDLFKIAFKGQAWRILKYVQEQATGMSGETDGVGENSYNNIVSMVGNENLVKECVSLLAEKKRKQIAKYLFNHPDQSQPGLVEAIGFDPQRTLFLNTKEKIILTAVYRGNIEGERGKLEYLKSSSSDRYYYDNNLSKSSAKSDVENKIESLNDDIKYLLEMEDLPIHDKYDAEKYLRDMNDLVKTYVGIKLFESNEYYQLYLKLFDKIEAYLQQQFGELNYEDGGTVAGSNAKLVRDIKKDFIFIASLKGALDAGTSTSGWDINLFKSSFYNKLAKLAKEGRTDNLREIFAYIPETEKTMKLKGPVFTDAHKIWKLKPAEIQPEPEQKEYPVNKPLRMADIPEALKQFLPVGQLRSIIGNDELWEVMDRLYGIIQRMPHTYQTEKTPTDEKIVYLHYFYGGSDWYIVEKDKGYKGDTMQTQAFGYTILNGDHEMAEWGYINIEELKTVKNGMIELDFFFDPIPFGKLKKQWEDQPEEEPVQQIKPAHDTFHYGTGYNVPEYYSQNLLSEIYKKGFHLLENKSKYVVLSKNGHTFYLNDNGGEFNLGDINTKDHIGDIPYNTTRTGNVGPTHIADEIVQIFNKYYSKGVTDTEPKEKFAPRPGVFYYGSDFGVPENYPTQLVMQLRNQGFGITKSNGLSLEILKDSLPKMIVYDNGGEFNLSDKNTKEHIASVPYSITSGIADPADNAEEINDFYQQYYVPEKPTIKLSDTMKTIHLDENRKSIVKTDDDEEDDPDYDPAYGKALRDKWITNSATLMADYGIDDYDLEGLELNIDFTNGQGSLDLASKATPHSYSPNNYEALKKIQQFLLSDENTASINVGQRMIPVVYEEVLNKAAELSYDDFNLWYAKTFLLQQGNAGALKDTLKLLGLNIDTDILKVYNEARKKSGKQALIPQSSTDPIIQPENTNMVQMYQGKKQSVINTAIRSLLLEKGIDRNKYSADELAFLKLYEGAGGLANQGEKGARLLDQFFTPVDICGKMWGIALKYGFKFQGANILEPAVGSGRFLQFIPKDSGASVTAYDVDETSYMLCKVLFPDYDIRHGSFEEMFFKGRRHIGMAGVTELYDLVITNPPYREYKSEWAPLGEKDATGASTFEMYFIARGIDVLKPGGLLIMLIPNTFLSNGSKYNDFKNKLMQKADFLNAYRLPNGVFGNTDVGTDILVLQKK